MDVMFLLWTVAVKLFLVFHVGWFFYDSFLSFFGSLTYAYFAACNIRQVARCKPRKSHFDIRATLRSEALAAAAVAMTGAFASAGAADSASSSASAADATATALASLSLSSSLSAPSSAAPALSKVEVLERLFVRHWDDFCVQAAEQFRLKEV
jgi:hypothetical protein